MIIRSSPHRSRMAAAFSRVDVLAAIGFLALLFFIAVPLMAAPGSASHRIVCLSNLKRLGQSFLLYAVDNEGYAPHPTWGSDLTGPNGWAYATRNDGRFPEAPVSPRSQLGKSYEVARKSQLPFLKMGQVWPYLMDEETYLCPGDVAEWNSGWARTWMIRRPWKLATYGANGATIGYGRSPDPIGSTMRLSAFRPDDVLLWESTETDGFYFNDAGSSPVEPITSRHDIGGHVAGADGGAERMDLVEFMRQGRERSRNRLWCNPLTPSGGEQ